MSSTSVPSSHPSLGIIGFGAFGRLMARHLWPHFRLCAHDPVLPSGHCADGVALDSLAAVAGCPIVVLAMPVSRLADTVRAIGPHLQQGALVLDVGSVKVVPADIMLRELPTHVGIVATHPLFGPAKRSERDCGAESRGVPGPRRGRPPRRCLPTAGTRAACHHDDARRP